MVSIILLSDLTDVFYLLLQSHFFPFFCVTKSIGMKVFQLITNRNAIYLFLSVRQKEKQRNDPFFCFSISSNHQRAIVYLPMKCSLLVLFFSICSLTDSFSLNDKILNKAQNSSSHMNAH